MTAQNQATTTYYLQAMIIFIYLLSKTKIMRIKNAIFLIIALIIVASLLAINWTPVKTHEENKTSTEQEIPDYYHIEKRESSLFFNITQNKPSPCHIISFHKSDFEKEIILDLDFEKYSESCSSGNRVDRISGEIEIEDPKSIEIRVDGNRAYYREFENE